MLLIFVAGVVVERWTNYKLLQSLSDVDDGLTNITIMDYFTWVTLGTSADPRGILFVPKVLYSISPFFL